MIPAEIIKKKRAGKPLTPSEIKGFFDPKSDPTTSEAQLASMMMAIFFQGLNPTETASLLQVIIDSGKRLQFQDLWPNVVDKHSTGGVGDKTSLILAPLVASLGFKVPMISGRGLGHTGGTLDKLESIPGLNVHLDTKQIEALIRSDLGMCFGAQTPEICPLDKKLYALRDITGTVESIPLICASILSKKIAEGIKGLAMDVKFGSGAFMKTKEEANHLLANLKDLGEECGLSVHGRLTDTNLPLGRFVGNALEVFEALEILKGRDQDPRLKETRDLSLNLAEMMINTATEGDDFKKFQSLLSVHLQSGRGFEFLERVVLEQGGDLKAFDRLIDQILGSGDCLEIKATRGGKIAAVDSEQIGYACIELGGGRKLMTQSIDPKVGIESFLEWNRKYRTGDLLFKVYTSPATPETSKQVAIEKLKSSVQFEVD